MHQSVGAIIKNSEGKILLIERVKYPFGWACPAGHVEEGGNPEEAIKREVFEETGLDIKKCQLLFHELLDWNKCSRGVTGHDWHLYEALEWSGELKQEKSEVKNINWFSPAEFKNIKFEEAYEYWFKKLGYI